MIPENFIQDLLSRTDIVALIDAYVPLKKSGVNYSCCCPFHTEKTPSFFVNPQKQFYNCFGCGAHGSAIGFLMAYQGLGFIDAVTALAQRQHLEVPNQKSHAKTAGQKSEWLAMLEIMNIAADFYHQTLKATPPALKYLEQRGISAETCAHFRLGYAPNSWQGLAAAFPNYPNPLLIASGLIVNKNQKYYDRFRGRIMIPIINQKEETIAFGGRVIVQEEPKYLNSPETMLFEKGRELFGLPQARSGLRQKNCAIIVEGYLDVILLNQHQITNVVATLGTAITAVHIQKLLRQVDHLIFCFDGDQAGRKAAWRALEHSLEIIADGKRLDFVFLPAEHDPDSFVRQFGKAGFERKLREATPLSEFFIMQIKGKFDGSTAEGRSQILTEAKPLLEKLKAPFLRLQIIKRLSAETGLAVAEIEQNSQLKTFKRSATPTAKRLPPSLARQLLNVILCAPQLIGELQQFIDQSAPFLDNSPYSAAITTLCALNKQHNAAISDVATHPALANDADLLNAESEFKSEFDYGDGANDFYYDDNDNNQDSQHAVTSQVAKPPSQRRPTSLTYAILYEALRGNAVLPTIEEVAANGLMDNFSAEELHAEFTHILQKLKQQSQQDRLAILQANAKKHGISGLSSEEKKELLLLMQR